MLTLTSNVAGGTEPEDYGPGYAKTIPQYDVTSTNFTCGRLAFDSAKKTQTADVVAGTEVSFRVNQGGDNDDPSALYVGHVIFFSRIKVMKMCHADLFVSQVSIIPGPHRRILRRPRTVLH
jgi:hypothetical protein